MTEPYDELLGRLRSADPVDPAALPAANDPSAQRLVEMIMHNEPNTSNDQGEPAVFEAAPANDFGPPSLAPTHTRRRPRRLGLMVGTAAAAIMLLVGALVFLPQSSSPALAAVKSAAQATAVTDSGRVSVVFSAEGHADAETGADEADGESESVSGMVEGSFDDANIAFSLDFAALSDGFEDAAPPVSETRLVDGVLYVLDDETGVWRSIEAPAILGSSLVDIVDPRQVLTTVQELIETEEIGPATIEDPAGTSVETIQYRSVVDLGDESLGQSGWLAGMDLADIDAEGQVTVDLYVEEGGLLRQLDLSGDLQEPDGGSGTATFEIVTSFYDLGGDVTIEAPTDAEPFDLFDREN